MVEELQAAVGLLRLTFEYAATVAEFSVYLSFAIAVATSRLGGCQLGKQPGRAVRRSVCACAAIINVARCAGNCGALRVDGGALISRVVQ